MMRRTGTILALLSMIFLARPAAAQSFSGTYTLQTNAGTNTLVLRQDASGNVQGELTMEGGEKVSLSGSLKGDQVLGIATMQQGSSLFRLTAQGQQVTYTIIPVTKDGKPDLNRAQNYPFTRQGAAAAAQPAGGTTSPFNGTFQTRPGEGPMTFSIQDDGQGHVTGTLSANNGAAMALDLAIVQSTGAAMGVLKASNGQATMVQMKPSGSGISLTIAPMGGKLAQGKTFECRRVGGGGSVAGGNPLGGGGGGGTLEGEFSDGNVFLELDDNGGGNYEGQLEFQGKSFPVTGHSSDGTNLKGKFQSGSDNFDFTARLNGSSLTFATGGTTYHLNREAEQTADTGNPMAGQGRAEAGGASAYGNTGGGGDVYGNTGGGAAAYGNAGGAAGYGGGGAVAGAADGIQRNPMAPATPGRLSDNNPQSLQWLNALRGKLLTQLSSYSSGTSGGYSSRRRMMLYPNGTFEYYSYSSVSVDVGGAFGNSGGQGTQRGTWRIVTANGTSYLALVFQGTMKEEYAELDFRNGTKYVDGTKTFVTNPQ